MKNLKKYMVILAFAAIISPVFAQTINWASLKTENRHIINVNMGAEHGITYGLGYSHQFRMSLFPIVTGVEYSFPSGNEILDDFKSKVGIQINWIGFQNFQFSTKIQGIFRRYENNLVRLVNFGSDFTGIIGYYRQDWFVAGEVGFDKAIVTQFRHTSLYEQQYPGVQDGWYVPATGGNFYYGLQAGLSLKKQDIYIKAGKLITQDFKTKPIVPFYAQLGCNFRFH